ncbi:MAG TPA: hypothetical protein VK826_18885 [Bacteroidia bacterium]|nr:hypothetical protein [Bacteroidia bacterium]
MGKAKRKRTLKKTNSTSSTGSGGMSHAALSKGFRDLGNQIAVTLDTNGQIVRIDLGVKDLKAYTLAEGKQKIGSGWGPFYRTRASGMDELVSTASVRELVAGMTQGKKSYTANEVKQAEEALNAISAVRLPTKYVGFAYKDQNVPNGKVQHPTSPDEGFWMGKKEIGAHGTLDLNRRRAVYQAMDEEAKNKSSGFKILETGMLRSLTFTVNEFMGPADADNLQTVSKITQDEKDEQMLVREQAKEEAVRLGAKRRGGSSRSRTRTWEGGSGQRDVSPERTLKPNDEKKVRPNSTNTAAPTVATPVLQAHVVAVVPALTPVHTSTPAPTLAPTVRRSTRNTGKVIKYGK